MRSVGERLTPGDAAPDFTLPDDTGAQVARQFQAHGSHFGGAQVLATGGATQAIA